MTDKLPTNLLALFQPRPPLRYLHPCDHAPEQRHTAPISGVAQFLEELKKPDPEYTPTESWLLARDRKKREKKERQERNLSDGMQGYNPDNDPQIRGDPYRTLFVSRLSYDVKEQDLDREFARFGPIDRIRLVRSKDSKKPRGYAFILFEREKDMKAAYKETDGIRIKDRRILVDVERGRTVKGWKPRRLGGGLGGRGYTKIPAARPTGPSGFGGGGGFGGFRGGHGGFRGGGGFGGRNFDRGPPRGGGFGNRGIGFQGNAPPNAPSGPGGGRNFGGNPPSGPGGYDRGPPRGGHGDDRGHHRDRMNGDSRGGGRDRFDDRRDRDRDGGYGGGGGGGGGGGRYDDSRKRGYEGGDSGSDPRRRRY